ncbi:hypothetical protein F4781DRAFT_80215 [Annulohypoxylon bovei var. microspora]|nr:hypothetical protein F4781DRAFT_80215 [Annulohypoxylon bovei var. microspora]
MRPSFSLSLIFASLTSLTTAAPQADPSIVFYAELFSTTSDCTAGSGSTKAFIYSRGSCQNIAIPGTGSAHVRYNEKPDTLKLTGWTGANCTGTAMNVGPKVGLCVPLNGTAIASWSY